MLDQDDETVVARVTAQGPDTFIVAIGAAHVMLVRHGAQWRADGAVMPDILRHGRQVTVFGDAPLTFGIPDPLARGQADHGGDHVLAPMPGLVQAVVVAVGDSVKAGDRVVVLEAMKMEHVLRAPRDGVVASVAVTPGAQVTAGALIIALEELP
jgi:3-methylcrotonyl-CoA carboxylase alpha subunit